MSGGSTGWSRTPVDLRGDSPDSVVSRRRGSSCILTDPNHREVRTLALPTEGSNKLASAIRNLPRFPGLSTPLSEQGPSLDSDELDGPFPPFGITSVVDRGVSSPKFMRPTIKTIPNAAASLEFTGLPLGIVACPFVMPESKDEEVPLVNLNRGSGVIDEKASDEGLPRCPRCHAYAAATMGYGNGGFLCGVCGHKYKVYDEYASVVHDHMAYGESIRSDIIRYELTHSTVDVVCTDESLPGRRFDTTAFVFVIDATYDSITHGAAQASIAALNDLRQAEALDVPVAIITYTTSVQFFVKDRSTIPVIEMPSVDSPFIPAPLDDLFMSLSSVEMESLLLDLSLMLSKRGPARRNSAGIAALDCGVQLLSAYGGGSLVLVSASVSDVGLGSELGKLQEESANPKGVWRPHSKAVTFIGRMTERCLAGAVGIDAIFLPPPRLDINDSNLRALIGHTGGESRTYHVDTCHGRGGDLMMVFRRLLTRKCVFDCVLKIRLSPGLVVRRIFAPWSVPYLGMWNNKDQSIMRLPRMHSDMYFTYDIAYETELPANGRAMAQIAILHRNSDGLNVTRLHTLVLPVSSTTSLVLKNTDVYSLLHHSAVRACYEAIEGDAWDSVMNGMLINILYANRLNHRTAASKVLILPDSLRALPLGILGLLKSPALRNSRDNKHERFRRLYELLSQSTCTIRFMAAPCVYPLYRSYTKAPREKDIMQIGMLDNLSDTHYVIPSSMPASGETITTDSMCLVDNGLYLYLYIGEHVDPHWLHSVFGVYAIDEDSSIALDSKNSEVAHRVLNVVDEIRRLKPTNSYQPLLLVRPKSSAEMGMHWCLVEDSIENTPAYMTYLFQVNKRVGKMTGQSD